MHDGLIHQMHRGMNCLRVRGILGAYIVRCWSHGAYPIRYPVAQEALGACNIRCSGL